MVHLQEVPIFSFGVIQVIDSAYELKDSTLHKNVVLSLEFHWGNLPVL